MRLQAIVALLFLFSLTTTAEASNKSKKVTNTKTTTKATAKAKIKTRSKRSTRPKHYLPKGSKVGVTWWANGSGKGYKEITERGVNETGTFRPDGSRRAKSIDTKTGETRTEYARGNQSSQITRQKNGDWVRQDRTKSGLIRVTSSKGSKKLITYKVPGNMLITSAQAAAQKKANDTGRPVKLDMGGSRRNEAFFPQNKKK